uniref:Uncharacterized protein n=1 Tax=Kalanchoe fedtschenkoi TaxID=63787 RepID=A0A7N0VK94_KALFE
MLANTASCSRGKAVLISVYVERPHKRRLSFHKPRHSYHNILLPQPFYKHGETRNGYSKKAQLLLYIQKKRETSRRAGASNPTSSNSQPPRTHTQVVAAKIKPKHSSSPSCLGRWKWRLQVPGFFQSIFRLKKKPNSGISRSTGEKIKVMVKRIQVQKSISKMFASLRGQVAFARNFPVPRKQDI